MLLSKFLYIFCTECLKCFTGLRIEPTFTVDITPNKASPHKYLFFALFLLYHIDTMWTIIPPDMAVMSSYLNTVCTYDPSYLKPKMKS